MSIEFQAHADALYRDGQLPSGNVQPWTITCWLYVVATTGAVQDWLWLHTPTTGTDRYCFAGLLSDLAIYIEGDGDSATGAALAVGTWYWVAVHLGVRDWTASSLGNRAHRLRINVTDEQVVAGTLDAWTPARLRFGNRPDAGRHGALRMAAYKEWRADLSPAELLQEMPYRTAQRTADLVSEIWLTDAADVHDRSLAGNDFSVTGAPGSAADPPITDAPPAVGCGAPILGGVIVRTP